MSRDHDAERLVLDVVVVVDVARILDTVTLPQQATYYDRQ